MTKLRHKSNHRNFKGFTIIELSLSIAFIAVLSITIVLIITNAISSYHRGLTLNQINTAGMDLVDDLRAAVQNSPARSVTSECANVYNKEEDVKACQEDHALRLVVAERYGSVTVGSKNIGNDVPLFGVFCTGAYSYIWNSGYFFNPTEYKVSNVYKASLKYRLASQDNTNASTSTFRDFKLLKVEDENRSVCVAAISGAKEDNNKKYNSVGINNNAVKCSSANGECVIDITTYEVINEAPIDIMVGTSGNNLAIYDLSAAIPAESSNKNSLFYSASFILGTVQGGINIKTSGNFCATPGGYNAAVANFDYCAINKFNFAAQASGG